MMRQLEDEHWWFVARREIIAALIRRLNPAPSASILEVGCGTGGNIRMLGDFGTVTCVEQDESAAAMARQRGLAPILAGELPNGLPEFQTQFDIIALFDVIEHVDEDRASLETLVPLLKPNGNMIITVPAFNFLWSQHDDENQHKRRYRKRDLKLLARQANLTLDYVSYFNTWLFPPVAAARLFRKVFPYKESWRDMQQPNPRLNSILKNLFGSEKYAIGRVSLPFGISLIALLSHPEKIQ